MVTGMHRQYDKFIVLNLAYQTMIIHSIVAMV